MPSARVASSNMGRTQGKSRRRVHLQTGIMVGVDLLSGGSARSGLVDSQHYLWQGAKQTCPGTSCDDPPNSL